MNSYTSSSAKYSSNTASVNNISSNKAFFYSLFYDHVMIKRVVASLLMIVMLFGLTRLSLADAGSAKLSVVTTNFAPYDFIRQIAGDRVELSMLVPPGSESHSYEPSPKDIIKILESDVFIYAGGEGDTWVERIIVSMDERKGVSLAMIDMVEAVPEEIVEGMEEEAEAFDPSTIKDRPITDFDGEWVTILPLVEAGKLDKYVQTRADATEASFDETLAAIKSRLRSDYDYFSLKNGVATIGGVSALYNYAGFQPIMTSALYILELADGTPNMPRYLMFNDHNTGGESVEAHDHGNESVAHTHFWYGNDIDEVMSLIPQAWATFYVDATASEDAVIRMMNGETKAEQIHSGYFADSDIEDRPGLADWQGEWKSGYPYVATGALDFVWPKKAESGDKTAEGYKEYYLNGYKTDFDKLIVKGDTITYFNGGEQTTVEYRYMGFSVLNYEKGNRGVRFNYQAVEPVEGAPEYIQFSDHNVSPAANLAHFHIYMNADSFESSNQNLTNWPTYFPVSFTEEDIGADLIGHDHSAETTAHEHAGEVELDEHVWTSPANAKLIVAQLTETLASLDPANASLYRENSMAYLTKLDALDAAFRDATANAARSTIVFGDRFPFRYLANAYNLTYYAAFPGCSTETEASAATVAFLIDKVRGEGIPVVFHVELSNGKMANAISESTGAKVLELHACHNVSKAEFDGGVTYLELMTRNVENLREALR